MPFEQLLKTTPEQRKRLLDSIGNTPLIFLKNISRMTPGVEIYAKVESFNPGGSVKDRPAYRIITEAEKSGQLTPDKVVLDATSGNTGIAYAMIAAVKGYRLKLCVPSNVSAERKKILQVYGAEVVWTDPDESSDGAIRAAREIYQKNPEHYFYADQYNNPNNWKAHYDTTGPEIWHQTKGKVTHFVAGLGTSGTLMGTGRRLRVFNLNVQLISVEPDSPFHGLEGLKRMDSSIVPGIYDSRLTDNRLEVRTEDAYHWVKRLAREEGILAGVSSGANLAGAFRTASALKEGVVVVMLPDGADKYLSDKFWSE